MSKDFRYAAVLLSGLLMSVSARATEEQDAKAECENKPEIQALHFGAKRDKIAECVQTALDQQAAERKNAHEAELAKLPPIHRYAACVSRPLADAMAYSARLQVQLDVLRARSGDKPDAAQDDSVQKIAALHECLDTKLSPAMAVADVDDLKKALKDYYVASQSLIDSIGDGSAKRAVAGQAFDEASNRLHLEAVSAGKW